MLTGTITCWHGTAHSYFEDSKTHHNSVSILVWSTEQPAVLASGDEAGRAALWKLDAASTLSLLMHFDAAPQGSLSHVVFAQFSGDSAFTHAISWICPTPTYLIYCACLGTDWLVSPLKAFRQSMPMQVKIIMYHPHDASLSVQSISQSTSGVLPKQVQQLPFARMHLHHLPYSRTLTVNSNFCHTSEHAVCYSDCTTRMYACSRSNVLTGARRHMHTQRRACCLCIAACSWSVMLLLFSRTVALQIRQTAAAAAQIWLQSTVPSTLVAAQTSTALTLLGTTRNCLA